MNTCCMGSRSILPAWHIAPYIPSLTAGMTCAVATGYLKENRRIKRSEAVQSEAAARREDASAATEMMGLLERTVAHMERMNAYNESNAESLLLMVRERDQLNDRLKRDLELLQMQRTEDHRRIRGLEKTVERELNWRKESERHYCAREDCDRRLPLLIATKSSTDDVL